MTDTDRRTEPAPPTMPETNWLEVVTIPTMTLEAFAKANGLVLTVKEHRQNPQRFTAQFKHAEVMTPTGMLSSNYGDGPTQDAAMADYAAQISLQRLAIDAYTPKRREIDVPRLTL